MNKLGDLIVSKTFGKQYKKITRHAARGIIYRDGKLLLIHSKFYHDYTFPGGGVEHGETDLEALVRECGEEAGAIIKNPKPYYLTQEKRELNENEYLFQESRFYLCEIERPCPTHLEDYEVALGYEPVWLTIDEAIKFDEIKKNLLRPTDYDGVLIRELRILYKLKADFESK